MARYKAAARVLGLDVNEEFESADEAYHAPFVAKGYLVRLDAPEADETGGEPPLATDETGGEPPLATEEPEKAPEVVETEDATEKAEEKPRRSR